jgi:hypothetical protein
MDGRTDVLGGLAAYPRYRLRDARWSQYLQKERAFNRFGTDPGPTVTAAIDVDPERLSAVEDSELRERYAAEAERMHERHDPDEAV